MNTLHCCVVLSIVEQSSQSTRKLPTKPIMIMSSKKRAQCTWRLNMQGFFMICSSIKWWVVGSPMQICKLKKKIDKAGFVLGGRRKEAKVNITIKSWLLGCAPSESYNQWSHDHGRWLASNFRAGHQEKLEARLLIWFVGILGCTMCNVGMGIIKAI